jgi:hypothetical protein
MIELQKIDANCNDCKFMQRRQDLMKEWDHLHKGSEKASHRLHYGTCVKFDKIVTFIPNTCQLETQECFEHRRL